MKRKRSAPVIVPVIVLIVLAGVLAAQSSSVNGRRFANPYLTMTVASGWTERPPADKELSLVKSKYVLTINPVFDHASGVEGGRFSEIVQGMPSVDAVMGNVDQPASGAECSLSPSESLQVTKEMRLGSLYTDSSKTKNGCSFPAAGLPAWFGSFTAGDGPESEYTITLSYTTPDVNSLPRKGSRQLTQTFAEVVSMLKTLHLIPPIVIAKISPQSAAPGETITIYGSGFMLSNSKATAMIIGVGEDLNPVVADDGKSLTFEVPASILTVSCQEGRILTGGFCLPIPAGHIDVNDCPRKSDGSANFCGIPIPPASYEILISAGGVRAAPMPFSVTAPKPMPVSISLLYPNAFVSEGNIITVRGSGFVARGNTVRIGDVEVNNLPSADGKTITFRAPERTRTSLIHSVQTFRASVVNANGESNSISFAYR
jgi:IPT/TIG domain